MIGNTLTAPRSADVRASLTDALPSVRSVAIAAALLAVLVRLPFVPWLLTVDEAGYAYGARWWFNGVTMYSDELWFDRPQGIFVAFRVGMWILGESTEAMRITVALWAAATTAILVVIADRMLGRRVAIIAGVGYAVFSSAPLVEGFVANAELFMLLPATAAVWAIWRRSYGWAGVLVGIAILLKPSGAAMLPFAAIWLLQDREPPQYWLRFAAGVAALPLVAVAHGVATVGVYGYFYPTLLFRLGAGSNSNPLLHLLAGWWTTAPVWLPLLVLAFPGWRILRSSREGRFLTLWVATAVAGMAMGGNWFLHYFLQMLPPLAVLAAASIVHLSDQSRLPQRAVLPIAGGLAVVTIAGLIAPWAIGGPATGADRLFDMPGYPVNSVTAAYIEETTTADDLVYVAVFHPDIIYLSNRRAASPYLYAQQITESEEGFDSVIALLEGREPAVVVAIPSQLRKVDVDRRIRDAIEQGYVLERSFGDLDVYRRAPASAFADDRTPTTPR